MGAEKMKVNRKLIAVFIFLCVFVCASFCGSTNSQEIISVLNNNVTYITLNKSIDSGKTYLYKAVFMNEKEQNEFCDIIREMSLKEKHLSPIAFDTSVRYYLQFQDLVGNEIGSMEFYENQILLFDFHITEGTYIHKRYEIQNASISSFFESILLYEEEF